MTADLWRPYMLLDRMASPSFDATHAVRFDLAHGAVRAGEGTDALLLVPSSALVELTLSAPVDAIDALGRALGAAIGRRAAARLSDARGASVESFVTQLAGEAAVAGIGALRVERWGRALVIVIERSPLNGALLLPAVAALVEAASGRKVWCTLLMRDEHVARVLVGSERGTERVRAWIEGGVPWGEALAKLHGGGA